MNNKLSFFIFILLTLYLAGTNDAQTYKGKFKEANYDESKVPEYVLPDILTSFDGKKIKTVQEWEQTRRPEIIHFFEQNMYGEVPSPADPIIKSFELISKKTLLGGLCTRKDIQIILSNSIGKVTMPLVLFVPNNSTKPVPVILLANGSDIKQNGLSLNDSQRYGQTRNGIPLHQLMTRGIGLATVDYQAFATDRGNKEGKVSGGITNLFFAEGQKSTKENEWGMIAIWAYALQAGMDYLVTNKNVDSKQIAPLGCSISGKVALWSAVTDKRFGGVLLSTAGHGADAIWRREYGETLENMCKYLPTWICRNANKYAKNVHKMPVDQHSLLACMAPRPLYVATAQHDLWADQLGQWIGTYNAASAYDLYGKYPAFNSEKQPPLNKPIIESSVGFHVRSGVHELERYDWEKYMQFMEYHFLKIKSRTVEEVYSKNKLK